MGIALAARLAQSFKSTSDKVTKSSIIQQIQALQQKISSLQGIITEKLGNITKLQSGITQVTNIDPSNPKNAIVAINKVKDEFPDVNFDIGIIEETKEGVNQVKDKMIKVLTEKVSSENKVIDQVQDKAIPKVQEAVTTSTEAQVEQEAGYLTAGEDMGDAIDDHIQQDITFTIPPGSVLVAANAGVPNPAPIPITVTIV